MYTAMSRAGFTEMETEQYMYYSSFSFYETILINSNLCRYLLNQQLKTGNEKGAADVYKKAVGRALDSKLMYCNSKNLVVEKPKTCTFFFPHLWQHSLSELLFLFFFLTLNRSYI